MENTDNHMQIEKEVSKADWKMELQNHILEMCKANSEINTEVLHGLKNFYLSNAMKKKIMAIHLRQMAHQRGNTNGINLHDAQIFI